MAAKTPPKRTPLRGERINLWEPEPWDEPVEGAEMADQIVAALNRYLILPPMAAEAIALWVLFTHAFDAAQTSPRLALTSALHRCGKTTTLDLLSGLVPRPLPTSNISPAAVFRIIEETNPTLLIDEADTFLEEREELRGLLNSGHRKNMAYVIRTVGEDFEPRRFTTWCPMALARIGSFPQTLEDRSLLIHMQRKRPDQVVASFSWKKMAPLRVLASQAARWVGDNMREIEKRDPERPRQLVNDRAMDNWTTPLAIAELLGGHWPELGRKAAVCLTLEESDFIRHGDEAVMTLVRERWAQQQLPMSEWEIRRRLEKYVPADRIGTVIGQLIAGGSLTVAGGRVPNRMLAPAGDEGNEGDKEGKDDGA